MSGRRRESSVSRLHPWRPLFDPLPLQEKAWSKDQGCRSAGALARSSPLPEGEWSEWWTSFTDRRRALHRRNYTTHPTLRQRQTHPCDQENARQDDEQLLIILSSVFLITGMRLPLPKRRVSGVVAPMERPATVSE